MKQLLQSLKDGTTELATVPAPKLSINQVRVQTKTSLVSAGTERMLVEFGKGNLVQKARSQPDKVEMVPEKANTDGVSAAFDAVRSELDQPVALGCCNVGRVIEVGNAIERIDVGERVVPNGNTAEVVSMSKNLCAHIPDCVSVKAAAFTVLGVVREGAAPVIPVNEMQEVTSVAIEIEESLR